MKKSQLLVLGLLFSFCMQGQVWTWMHGTDTINTFAINGPNIPVNRPPSLTQAQPWTDNTGNFYMYGGQHKLGNAIDVSNEMWKFKVSSNQWTKIAGNAFLTSGNYGTMNVPAPSNNPGSRMAGATWRDSNNNMWLFGGYGVGTSTVLNAMNDLWRYNPSTNEWTWMNGPTITNQNGVYGTLGVGSSTTVPGARVNALSWIVNDTLYLYGGLGYAASTWGTLADMWRYVISTGQWTWIKGSNTSYQNANFGTINFSSPTNFPGSRSGSCTWVDNNRTLWLFGGNTLISGFGTCSSGDLWRYNISTNIWTWQKGSNLPYPAVQYGNLGVPSATAEPGTRAGTAAWTDNNGDLWLYGSACLFPPSNITLNSDTWKYSRSTNQWTWVHGPNYPNAPGQYGIRMFPQTSNLPPRRNATATFKDAAGNFWLYGGDDNTAIHYTDLWRFSTCTLTPAPPAGLAASASTVCAGASVQFSVNPASSNIFWQTLPTGAVQTGTSLSLLKQPGSYTVIAMSSNMCTVSANNPSVTFTVHYLPLISSSGGTLCSGSIYTLSASGANTYSWSTGSTTVQPTSNLTFTVTGFGNGACPAQNSVVATLTVFQNPVLTINSGSICAGAIFTLSPGGAINYSYTTGSQSTTPLVSPPVPGASYTITGISANGCTNTISTSVVTFSLPVISVTGGSICAGKQFTITPTGATSYSFSSGNNIVSPAQTQTYSVNGSSPNGCQPLSATILTVSVMPNPQISFINKDSVACVGLSRSYTVQGASTYLWQDNSTGNTFTATFSGGSQTITALGTDTNNCSNNISLVLVTDPCTGLPEYSDALHVYPNPFQNNLLVETNAHAVLTLTNLQGQQIFEKNVDAGLHELELAELSQGIYLLTIRTNNGTRIIKTAKF